VRRVGGILLEGQELGKVAVLVRLGVAYLRAANGTVPPDALKLRDLLDDLARETRNRDPAQVSAGSAPGRETAKPVTASVVAQSAAQEVSVRDTASLLGVSEQRVRALCRSCELTAVRSPAGWRIDADSAAALAARRKGAER
jgi:hypothetical protein